MDTWLLWRCFCWSWPFGGIALILFGMGLVLRSILWPDKARRTRPYFTAKRREYRRDGVLLALLGITVVGVWLLCVMLIINLLAGFD